MRRMYFVGPGYVKFHFGQRMRGKIRLSSNDCAGATRLPKIDHELYRPIEASAPPRSELQPARSREGESIPFPPRRRQFAASAPLLPLIRSWGGMP